MTGPSGHGEGGVSEANSSITLPHDRETSSLALAPPTSLPVDDQQPNA